MITAEQLLTDLDFEGLMPIAQFVATEINDALAHGVQLNGLSWLDADAKCGCLIATASKRAGIDVSEVMAMARFDIGQSITESLGSRIGLDAEIL